MLYYLNTEEQVKAWADIYTEMKNRWKKIFNGWIFWLYNYWFHKFLKTNLYLLYYMENINIIEPENLQSWADFIESLKISIDKENL